MQISVFSHKFWHKHHVLEIASCSLKGRASQLTNSRLWQTGRPVRSAQKDGMERQACEHVTALLHASRSWCPDSFCLLNWPYPSLSLIFLQEPWRVSGGKLSELFFYTNMMLRQLLVFHCPALVTAGSSMGPWRTFRDGAGFACYLWVQEACFPRPGLPSCSFCPLEFFFFFFFSVLLSLSLLQGTSVFQWQNKSLLAPLLFCTKGWT